MIEALSERIKAASGNLAELDRIKSEIDQLAGPDARELKLKAGLLLFKAKQAATEISVKSVLARENISKADGRALYRYSLDARTFEQLRALLRARGRFGFATASWDVAALFVLWGAHWFQREYRGGIRKWEDVGAALGVALDGNDARRLVREGLRTWGRESVRSDTMHQWLMTLAVEGGFPAGVLGEKDGWVGRYLLRVVAQLLAADAAGSDVAFVVASKEAEHIPHAYQQDIFYAVAAELAEAIADLRRRAEHGDRPRGVTSSEWLDVIEPGWRNNLPISADDEAAAKLVNGLIESSTVGLVGDRAIACERLLQLKDGVWRSAVRLGLDGQLQGRIVQHLAGRSERLRVYPSAALGRYTYGELALLEPPADEDADWRVRPSRRDAVIHGIPMSFPVSIELRCDGKPIGQGVWPKGEPVRGDLAVLGGELLAEALGDELTLLGVASGYFKPKLIAVAIPSDWAVEGVDADARVARHSCPLEDGRALWSVAGSAIVRAPDGDSFRVVSDATSSRRDELRLEGTAPKRIDAEDTDLELFAGAPSLRLSEGARIRNPEAGETKWRVAGERAWRNLPMGQGLIDVAWMDLKAAFIRDRRRIFVFPPGSDLSARRERDAMVYTPAGFSAAGLGVDSEELEVERRDQSVVVRFSRNPRRRARLTIKIGDSRPIAVNVPFELGAGIASWSGVRIAGAPSIATAAHVSLAELADCVAFADGRSGLNARLLDRDGKVVRGTNIRWSFADELPLRGVAEELATMMAQFGDIDLSTELSLLDGSAFWRIHQFEMSMSGRGGQLRTMAGFARQDDIDLFGRAVDVPWEDRALGHWTFADRLASRFPDLPPDLAGSWIIYGRRGEVVVSRPMVRMFQAKDDVGPGFPTAALVADFQEREHAIAERFGALEAGDESSEADLNWLVRLAATLNGLPPASFNALSRLPGHPIAAARVLMHAGDADARQAILGLARGLPFAWYLVPIDAWRRAFDLEKAACEASLRAVNFPDAARVARRALEESVKAIAEAAPILAWPLLVATGVRSENLSTRRPLGECAQDHIRRYGDEVDETAKAENFFRSRASWHAPVEFERFDPVHYEALDAPCFAALMAAKGAGADAYAVRRIKSYERADSVYFGEAFEARLIDVLNGK